MLQQVPQPQGNAQIQANPQPQNNPQQNGNPQQANNVFNPLMFQNNLLTFLESKFEKADEKRERDNSF